MFPVFLFSFVPEKDENARISAPWRALRTVVRARMKAEYGMSERWNVRPCEPLNVVAYAGRSENCLQLAVHLDRARLKEKVMRGRQLTSPVCGTCTSTKSR